MTRAEEYDYNKFLSDSSDDEKLDGTPHFVIKQADDDMVYQEAYSRNDVAVALSKVLEESSAEDKYIKTVKDYFFHSGEAVINNSKIAKNDNDV